MSSSERPWAEQFVRGKIGNTLLSPKAPNDGPEYWKRLLIGGLPVPGVDPIFVRTRQLFCYCLYGAPGAGQRNLALAFAADCQRSGYRIYDLPGYALRGKDLRETSELVEEAFAAACAQPSVLLLENPGDAGAWDCILACCERLDLTTPLKVVATEEEESVLSESLKGLFFLCRFELPEEEERVRFFEKYLPAMGRDETSPLYMASETGGLSYDELLQLVNLLRLQLKAEGVEFYMEQKKAKKPEEEILQAVQSLRKDGDICITTELFEDSLAMLRRQKLSEKRQLNVPSMKVLLEGGVPVAAGFAAGAAPGAIPGGAIPEVKTGGEDDADLEQKSRDKVLEDLNERFKRRGGE